MRSTFLLLIKLFCLLLLVATFTGCGGGGSSGSSTSGGFTNPDNTINVSMRAETTSLPANVNLEPASLQRPFTTEVVVDVTREDSTVFDDGETEAQIQLEGTRHGFITVNEDAEEDNDDNEPPQPLATASVPIASGKAVFYFTSSNIPGTAKLTASVRDPNSDRPIAASIDITVEPPPTPRVTSSSTPRVASSITFTGPFVNEVLAGASFFNDEDSVLADGSYSRTISVVVNDQDGNPMQPDTPIDFFLVNSPIVGYPDQGAGSFFIAGSDSNPLEGAFQFNAPGGQFVDRQARTFDRLVLDGQKSLNPVPDNNFLTAIRTVQTMASNTQLFIDQQATSFSVSPDNGDSVPYVIGRALNGTISSPALTDSNGVATTLLTYPAFRLGQTAILVACTTDRSVCGILNTCDSNGSNCNAVYLGVNNGTNRILRTSQTSLEPNTTTNVVQCLQDVNLTPLPATTIRYAIGATGSAAVMINGSPTGSGTIQTGADGCTTVTIASSGQTENSAGIPIAFNADGIAQPLEIIIKSPGAGNLGATLKDGNPGGTGEQLVNLQLLKNDGTPLSDTLIAHEVTVEDQDNSCDGFPLRQNITPTATVSYDAATQLTDAQGRLDSLVGITGDNGDLITVKYNSFGGAITEVKFPIVSKDFVPCAEGALQLTAFQQDLAPNQTTLVKVCLKDSLQRSVPNRSISYSVGSSGGAEVLINGNDAAQGSLQTGNSGCIDAEISSIGVIERAENDKIEISFIADNAENPAVVNILPLEGVLTGTVKNKGKVKLTLKDSLTQQPIVGSLIGYEASGACTIDSVNFNPKDRRTNVNGRLTGNFTVGEAAEGALVTVTFTSPSGAQDKVDLTCKSPSKR